MAPENRNRDGSLTGRPVSENVNAGVLERLSTWLGYLPPGATRSHAARLIQRLHVDPPDPSVEIQQLSGGNQQKVIVGRAVAAKPSVIIFDEPTQGIDGGTKAEMYRLIAGLAEAGRGIILISSELIELSRLCDRILVIRNGRVWDELRGGVDEETLFAACAGENY
jgi:ABC-type sugar transport system ATPase subunit